MKASVWLTVLWTGRRGIASKRRVFLCEGRETRERARAVARRWRKVRGTDALITVHRVSVPLPAKKKRGPPTITNIKVGDWLIENGRIVRVEEVSRKYKVAYTRRYEEGELWSCLATWSEETFSRREWSWHKEPRGVRPWPPLPKN